MRTFQREMRPVKPYAGNFLYPEKLRYPGTQIDHQKQKVIISSRFAKIYTLIISADAKTPLV